MFRRAGKFFAGIAASCMLCGVLSANDFNEVRRHLDEDGSYFEINCTGDTQVKLTEFFHELSSGAVNLELPEDQLCFLSGAFVAAEAAFEFSGIKEVRAYGKSSKPVPGGWFRNRSFYLLVQPQRGLIWNVVPQKNSPILEIAGKIPITISDAVIADLDFTQEAFQSQLKKIVPAALRSLVKESGVDMQMLAQSVSGRWQILIFPGNRFLAIIPDTRKTAFTFLQGLLEGKAEIQPNGALVLDDLVIAHEKNWLVLARKITEFDEKTPVLKDMQIFKNFSETVEDAGVALFCSSALHEPEKQNFFGCPFTLDPGKGFQIGIVRREANGFSLRSLSDKSIPCENVMSALDIICRLLAIITEPDEDIVEAVDQHDVCQQNLQQIFSALNHYRKEHGHFPEGLQADGWKALFAGFATLPPALVCPDSLQAREDKIISPENCSYVYFGDWGKLADATLPLVIDIPVNHTGAFNVLYSDGSVSTLEQENITSVRKAASLLHTINRYDETRFLELMRRAGQIDQLLKLE